MGAQVPISWSLDFSLALTFIALLIPNIQDRASIWAAISAGIFAVLTIGLPYNSNLLIAIFVGIIIGLWIEE